MRERIITVTGEIIAALGIKFTMSDLASSLAVSKHTLYEYFHSKEELIGAIVDSLLDEIDQRFKKIFQDENLTLADKIKSFTLIYPIESLPHIERFLDDIRHYYPEEWEKIERFRKELWQLLEGIFREGVDSHYFKPANLMVVQMMFNGMTDQLLNYKFLIQNNITIQDALKAMEEIILYGLVIPDKKMEG